MPPLHLLFLFGILVTVSDCLRVLSIYADCFCASVASGGGELEASTRGIAPVSVLDGISTHAASRFTLHSVGLLRRLSEPYIREWTLRAALGPSFAAIAPRFLRLELDSATDATVTAGYGGSSSSGGSGGRYQLREGFRTEADIKARLTGTPDEALIAPLVQLLSNACLVPVHRLADDASVSLPRSVAGGAVGATGPTQASAYLHLPSSPHAAVAASAGMPSTSLGSGFSSSSTRYANLLAGYAFHPRADMHSTTSFLELSSELQDALSRLHALHFSQRMHDLWRVTGFTRLSVLSRLAGEIGADLQQPECACCNLEPQAHHGDRHGEAASVSATGRVGEAVVGLPLKRATGPQAGAAAAAPHQSRPGGIQILSPLLLADDQHVRHPALRDVIRHVGILGSDCHRCPPLSSASGGSVGEGPELAGAGIRGGDGSHLLLPAAMAGGIGPHGGAGDFSGVAAGFLHPVRMEWATAAAPSWHDMPPLRQWWEDNTAAAWAYYRAFLAPHLVHVDEQLAEARSMALALRAAGAAGSSTGSAGCGWAAGGSSLSHGMSASGASHSGSGPLTGELPRQCTPDVAAAFFRHYAHGSASFVLYSAADWLAMDGRLRRADAHERIDIPEHEHHEWRWRLPVPLETLAGAPGEDLRSSTRNILADARRTGYL